MSETASKLPLVAMAPDAYLGFDDVIDQGEAVAELAARLRAEALDDVDFARRAYLWVRDEVAHSYDVQDSRVTLRASEVLREGVGLCYAKSHLLAAILRSEGIPAGLCYQRLTDGEGGHILHGLVAVHLEHEWHRLDVRGNKPGVDAQFRLDEERLAWTVDPGEGEVDYPIVAVAPVRLVVDALRAAEDILIAELPSALPDWDIEFRGVGEARALLPVE